MKFCSKWHVNGWALTESNSNSIRVIETIISHKFRILGWALSLETSAGCGIKLVVIITMDFRVHHDRTIRALGLSYWLVKLRYALVRYFGTFR